MRLRYIEDQTEAPDTPLLALAVVEGGDAANVYLSGRDGAIRRAVAAAMEMGDVTGKTSDEVVLYGGEHGPVRVVLLGIGKGDDLDAETLRRFAGRAVRVAERLKLESLAISLDLSLIHI